MWGDWSGWVPPPCQPVVALNFYSHFCSALACSARFECMRLAPPTLGQRALLPSLGALIGRPGEQSNAWHAHKYYSLWGDWSELVPHCQPVMALNFYS